MTQQDNESRDNPDRLSPEAERARDNFLSVRGRAVMAVVAVLIALSAIAYSPQMKAQRRRPSNAPTSRIPASMLRSTRRFPRVP